ncbi:hypothetical protein D3C77_455790 [compost metagenome]
MQGSDGQTSSAGAEQIYVAAAGDGAAGIHGLFQRLDITRQAPFAMTGIGVAPTDNKGLQAVFEGVLDKAVGRAQIEDVELVDLRRDDQQRSSVLFFAHGLVLDQLQQLVAKNHRPRGGGQVATDLERLGVDLARQPIVVAQVVNQMVQASEQAQAA